MKIVITAKKPVLVPGRRLPVGIPVEVAEPLGLFLIKRGEAVALEVKEKLDRPYQAAGETEPSFASPVGQVSPQTTAPESETGVKKRGRPRKSAG